MGMTVQIANVTKPLGAVRAMLAAGNKVVFETGNTYIHDKTRTIKTPLEERNGGYVFDIWRPKFASNRNGGNGNEGFARQAGPR